MDFVLPQDFATSSLHGEVAEESDQRSPREEVEQYQIVERRLWEQRYIIQLTTNLSLPHMYVHACLPPLLPLHMLYSESVFVHSSHPYIFFNQDGMSLTFVGFKIASNGDLIDAQKRVLEPALMTEQLKKGLKYQNVNFEEDYQQWSRQRKIETIVTVMGLTKICDPDVSYVLTADNLIKILAIHMRLRYCIVYACMFKNHIL